MSDPSSASWVPIAAGLGAGAISSIVCSPLDVAKTRLQVQGGLNVARYNGLVGSLRAIYREEGWRGGFRGLGPGLVTVPLFWALYFPVYGHVRDSLAGIDAEGNPNESNAIHHCIGAVSAGCLADCVTNPLWVVRTRMVTAIYHSTDAAAYTSTIGALRGIVQREGFLSLYKGLTASFLGLFHVAIQFPLYERLKRIARDSSPNGRETPVGLVLASGFSKLVASTITYPHEVLRARMQDSRSYGPNSLRATYRAVVTQEGLGALYTGLGVNLARVLPATVVTFVSYEFLVRWLNKYTASSGNSGDPVLAPAAPATTSGSP
eukprot:m.303966 g.303966  ORF g.303966 m.303966 type:complete len:320 (-) comp16433_c0_seq1:160-1119(-)